MATYLINRTPFVILDWKTHYERLYGSEPKYDNLKVFVRLCFASNRHSGKDKLDPRAYKCVYLGYKHQPKGFQSL